MRSFVITLCCIVLAALATAAPVPETHVDPTKRALLFASTTLPQWQTYSGLLPAGPGDIGFGLLSTDPQPPLLQPDSSFTSALVASIATAVTSQGSATIEPEDVNIVDVALRPGRS